ncbi:hypothetical protein BS78_07G127500 [Paspalum vaginatum]|nr:hypothetical protein BS78_07G127500 [Paspalum vaginatum]
MDPNTTYVLEIKMLGNRKKTRKDVGCLLIDKVIDSNLINFKDFVESIVEGFPLGYLEVAHIQYFDKSMKNFPEVKSDQDLMSMFPKHSKSKFVHMFIQYCHPSDPFVPISVWDLDDHGQPDIEVEQDEEDAYLKNPFADNEHVGIDEEVMYLEGRHDHPLHIVACSDEGNDKDGDEVWMNLK